MENYPGFENPIQGPWLMEQMKKQAEVFGTTIINDYVKNVNFKTFPFIVETEKEVFNSYSVVIATGAKAKWLKIEGESEYMGLGVSACATCDGFFFKDKVVAVVGGGNTAVEEALFLSNLCKKVFVIHRRDKFRAEKKKKLKKKILRFYGIKKLKKLLEIKKKDASWELKFSTIKKIQKKN